jgi:hypothetical protein
MSERTKCPRCYRRALQRAEQSAPDGRVAYECAVCEYWCTNGRTAKGEA